MREKYLTLQKIKRGRKEKRKRENRNFRNIYTYHIEYFIIHQVTRIFSCISSIKLSTFPGQRILIPVLSRSCSYITLIFKHIKYLEDIFKVLLNSRLIILKKEFSPKIKSNLYESPHISMLFTQTSYDINVANNKLSKKVTWRLWIT